MLGSSWPSRQHLPDLLPFAWCLCPGGAGGKLRLSQLGQIKEQGPHILETELCYCCCFWNGISIPRLAGAMGHKTGLCPIPIAPFPWDEAFFFLSFPCLGFFFPQYLHGFMIPVFQTGLQLRWVLDAFSWSPHTCSALGAVIDPSPGQFNNSGFFQG